MHTRKIPSSGAALPVIGCGTWRAFDVGDSAGERAPLAEVLRVLFEAGGSVIDSSPMYGRAEAVVGDLLSAAHNRDNAPRFGPAGAPPESRRCSARCSSCARTTSS